MGRLLRLAAALLGLGLYAWVAGVRNAPAVRARKAARRSMHRSGAVGRG